MTTQKSRTFLKQKPNEVADWFKERKLPFEVKARINMKAVYWTIGLGTVASVITILFWPPQLSIPEVHFPGLENVQTNTSKPESQSDSKSIQSNSQTLYGGGIPTISRNRNSNQVIARNQQNSTGSGLVSMGSTAGATLVNAVVSSNQSTPVIALVQGSGTDIPEGAKALGNATFDESSKRIQIRFHSFVYPDGEQRNISAIAMMPDGSSGLEGDYSSGEMRRQTGRFLGNFIGGMAQGMKERSQGSMLGGPFEPGSLRNGLLNGVAMSAEDQARNYSDSMTNERPSMSLQPGTSFLLYFEHEFNP